jgi:peptidoglycan hydrolase-like protein with peptidoglycan-binding domain
VADASQPYGDVSYADPGYQADGKKRYPIDSEEHCKAAWSYINQADNAGKYSPEHLASIKDRIKAAGKEYNITFEDSSRAFAAGEHPHVPAGSSTGGQFAAKGGGGNKSSAKGPHKSPHSGHPAMHPASHPASGNLGFDAKANHGTGYGSVNGDSRVHTLQQTLNRLGITDGHGKALKDDGKLGPKTTSAVKKLQTRLGMKADGQVSPEFLKAVAGMKTLPAHHTAKRGEDPIDMTSGRADSPSSYVRSYQLEDVSVRTAKTGREVTAYAAVFNVPAEILDQDGHYMEELDPVVFNRAISDSAPAGGRTNWRVGVFYNHGMTLHGTPSDRHSMPVGVPLEIKPDARGLLTRTMYHRSDFADEIVEGLESGAIPGYSFSGRFLRSTPLIPRGGFRAERGGSLRTVRRMESTLKEYGPTPFPAYKDAAILGVRSDSLLGAMVADPELAMRMLTAFRDGAPQDSPPLSGAPEWDSPPEDSPITVRSGRSVKEEIAARRSAFLQRYGSEHV